MIEVLKRGNFLAMQNDVSIDKKSRVLSKLLEYSRDKPDEVAFIFVSEFGQSEIKLTYRELEIKARQVAQQLTKYGESGSRVALLLPNGLPYVVCMYACMFAERISVPLYPVRTRDKHSRIDSVVNNCTANLVITCNEHLEQTLGYFENSEYHFECSVLVFEELEQNTDMLVSTIDTGQNICYLQYTSGSTGTPKGAVITYENIACNLDALIAASQCNEKDIFVNWLPLFHDLGLVNTLFLPTYCGSKSVIMLPCIF